jgi:hypothetical protein
MGSLKPMRQQACDIAAPGVCGFSPMRGSAWQSIVGHDHISPTCA